MKKGQIVFASLEVILSFSVSNANIVNINVDLFLFFYFNLIFNNWKQNPKYVGFFLFVFLRVIKLPKRVLTMRPGGATYIHFFIIWVPEDFLLFVFMPSFEWRK